MKKPTILFILTALLAALLAPAVFAKTPGELLSEGLYAEEVEGNLDSAIAIYQQVIDDPSTPRKVAGQALYHQGMCYMKKKQEQEARAIFQKLVTEYGDQTEIVEKVKPMLEELGDTDPAALMPPETMAYLEIGSPGMQVEKILNMLKGTPFENPLAAMGAGQQGTPGQGNNPAQMLGAMLNPSTLAEFKKIRGLGIGVVDFAQNGPPAAVVVLFPGKSDALRGLLTMALGMAGQPTDPIENMKTVNLPEGGAAAYDDSVVILASPAPKAREMLQWSVKQYKGRNSQPSLASANKSFDKISKQARQQNAVTLWVNIAQAYNRLAAQPNGLPAELQAADGLVNFQNVNDVIATLSLRETGVAVEANVGFKDGTRSPVYNLVRTPNLNKAALKAVPADAAALISMTLSGAGTAQAQAAGEKIRQASGQDLAPDIFGNIEQITLFAVPLQDATAPQPGQIPPIIQSIGLAVTSRNPQQTQGLLLKLLEIGHLMPAETQAAPVIPESGRFEIALAPGPKLFGYNEQANKTMVLSLNTQVVESSLTALRQDASVTSGGKLQDALGTLSATTSKLVLINIAGAIQLAAQNMTLAADEKGDEARQSLVKLIEATQKTTLRLQTSEEANSFGVRLSVSDLPPINEVVGPIQYLAQMAHSGRGAGGSEQAPAVAILKAPQAPKIDGNPDQAWAGVPSHNIGNVVYTPPSSDADLSAGFKTMYDSQALYFLVDVTDDELINDSAEFYQDDCVEIFIDADNSKSQTYDSDDFQYHFEWDAKAPTMGEMHERPTTGVQYAFARTDKGYRLEVALPWSTLGVKPAVGAKVGFDVHVNDDDDGGDRDTKKMWAATEDISWENPRALGTGDLAGLVGWWKLDETEGTKAADSSGCGHDGTVHGGAVWQPTGGKVGGALQLDGDDDYVDTGYSADLANWTVAVWVKSPAAPTNGDPSGPVHREKNYQINWNHPMDEFRGAAAVCIGGTWHDAGFGELKADTWYHLAATFDGGSLKAYTNGALVTTDSSASGAPDAETQTLKLGKHAADDYYFAGTIDDVHVYNLALPESQVQQLYQGK
jgi:tetratricopeptide (TPR) repeat protein